MSFIAVSVALMLLAGVLPALTSKRPGIGDAGFRILISVACLIGAVPAIGSLAGVAFAEVRLDAALPGGPWVFGVDAVSAMFLLAILVAGGASAVYGITYLRSERGRRGVEAAHFLVALLMAGLVFVVVARAAVPFLIGWEVMAVAAFLLIVFEHERVAVRRAGLLYIGATHAGTLALFAMFATWGAGAPDLTFGSLAARASDLPAGGSVVLVLALIGFGMKAGMVPFHFWLPGAHAAAPSHISALMSGVVIKMGIYGLFRVLVLVGSPPAWYGWVLLGIGMVSGVLGVVWALAQHDLKRLLAFHSVENVGIILIGLGSGTLGLSYGYPVVATLGFAGAALHTLNHALFKSLLFLGAGSVVHGTGTKHMDQLGGLAARMPHTAATFLIGATAIVGLPPLNGFVSEWLVFLSLLETGATTVPIRLGVIAAAGLGLIGALALACFAKVVGIVFLGSPRTPLAGAAHESPRGMLGPLFVLAGACILIGLLPIFGVGAALRAGIVVVGSGSEMIGRSANAAAAQLTIFSLATAVALMFVWLVRSWIWPRRDAASTETWACGYASPTARMQYTSSSFAAPLLAAWSGVSGIRKHRTPVSFSTHALEPVLDGVLRPAWRVLRASAAWFHPIQRGRLSHYLLYIGVAVVSLLLYLLAAGGAS